MIFSNKVKPLEQLSIKSNTPSTVKVLFSREVELLFLVDFSAQKQC